MSDALEGLTSKQARAADAHVAELASVPGVVGVVLGGSLARGAQRPDSDVDLGLFYRAAAPPSFEHLRDAAGRLHGRGDPVVTEPWEWGDWVNGGAWIEADGLRVDWLYREIEQLERVIDGADHGEFFFDYPQQPPYGFTSTTFLGEMQICRILHDPTGALASLQARVAQYPEALRSRLVDSRLWAVEFTLRSFATKAAARGEIYYTAGCLTRCASSLVHALFALNRRHLLNEKTSLAEIREFDAKPADFAERVGALLGAPGTSAGALQVSVERMRALFRETVELAGALYTPRYPDPARSSLANGSG